MSTESQNNTVNKESQNNKVNPVWNVLIAIGLVTIVISILGGILIIDEIGVETGLIDTEYNPVGMITGIAAIIQGSIFGILMIAFARLGESVNRIENHLTEQQDE